MVLQMQDGELKARSRFFEQMLHESEEKYRLLVENSPNLVGILQDGLLKYVNRTACEKLGWTFEEMVSPSFDPIETVIPPRLRDRTREIVARRILGERISPFEFSLLTRDGSEIAVMSSSQRITYHGKPADEIIFADITEHKKMDDALRASEAKYRLVGENVPVAVYSALPDGYSTNTFNSRRIQEVTGYSLEDYEKDPTLWSKILHPDDREHVLRLLKEHVRDKTPIEMEYRIVDKNGSVRWMRDKASAALNKKGEITEIHGFLEDITERKRAEEALQESEKLAQKTEQIDNISRLRDVLRKTPDTSIGLDLVLDGVMKDLQMDAGAVLVFNQKERVTSVRAFKSRIEGIMLNESYPLNCGLSECKRLTLDKAVSKIGETSCMLGTTSTHCAPINLGKEMHGSLVLGSQKAMTLDESDLTVLRLFANLASTVFEIENLAITPAKEVVQDERSRVEGKLELGTAYLVKNEVEKTFDFFAQTVLSGVEGLCITREYPPKIRGKYELKKTPVVWLTEENVNGEITVYSLQDLSVMIGNFLAKANRSIVLLDGVEYLVTNHGYESFLRFLQMNRSRFELLDSVLVIPVTEGTISEKELGLIERETKTLKISYR